MVQLQVELTSDQFPGMQRSNEMPIICQTHKVNRVIQLPLM